MSTSGRLTALALAAVVAAACAHFRPCETTQCLEDRRIRDEVLARIDARPSLRFFNIDVQTSHHEVYLEGMVDTEIDRSQAADIAMAVPGVRRVYNGLGLMGNANGGM
jgi:osmotically-inducible protein OsmY